MIEEKIVLFDLDNYIYMENYYLLSINGEGTIKDVLLNNMVPIYKDLIIKIIGNKKNRVDNV